MASSLNNDERLPVFVVMTCLNGFFQDVYAQPLGVTLMLVPKGGAVAVLASSGLNQAQPQVQLNLALVKGVLRQHLMSLGDAILDAKRQVSDPDVRRTYILFGDPAMQLRISDVQSTGTD